jgi:hypothetical protein
VNFSPTTTDMQLLVEDRTVAAGATPNATVGTGANTDWLMATIVFKAASATHASADTTGRARSRPQASARPPGTTSVSRNRRSARRLARGSGRRRASDFWAATQTSKIINYYCRFHPPATAPTPGHRASRVSFLQWTALTTFSSS